MKEQYLQRHSIEFMEYSFLTIENCQKGYTPSYLVALSYQTIANGTRNQEIFNIVSPKIDSLIFDHSIPLLAMTQKEIDDWKDEPQEYIYSQTDKFEDYLTDR